MSKGDFGYGATVSASYQRSGGIDKFQSIFNDTSNKIFRVNKNVSSLETISSGLETDSGTKRTEDKIHSISQETNRLAKEVKNNFKQMSVYISQPDNYRQDFHGNKQMQNKLQQSKLRTEFENALSRYHAIQNVLTLKIRSHIDEELHLSPAKQNTSIDLLNDSDVEPLVNTQALQQEQERELEAIKERTQRIQKLETDILDVNEIFKDLAVLIQEQGETIDSIEGNVEQAVVHVTEANVQLQRAKDYQKSARKRLCIIFMVVFVAAGVIGLIVYLSQTK